jgi:hypothetical protein
MSMDVTSRPVERGPGAGAVVLPIDDQLIEVDDHVAGPLGVNGIGEMGRSAPRPRAPARSTPPPATGSTTSQSPSGTCSGICTGVAALNLPAD